MSELDMDVAGRVIETALEEDLDEHGDITSMAIVAAETGATGRLVTRKAGVICGLEVARLVFNVVDPSVEFAAFVDEGARVDPGLRVATVSGPARSILAAERTALNLLQHMSGVATVTAEAVDTVARTHAEIFDTRKTLPGLRALEKYAVAVGGGRNHRMGLFDTILLKDNHIKIAGGVTAAVAAVRAKHGHNVPIEVETETPAEVREALAAGVDIIMLDNMSAGEMIDAVRIVDGRATVEASGGITLDSVEETARTGVDRISMGALTDAARLDISLEIDF